MKYAAVLVSVNERIVDQEEERNGEHEPFVLLHAPLCFCNSAFQKSPDRVSYG